MPTLNGVHVNKITSVFDTKKGLEAIRETVTKSKKLRITTIPPSLLKDILPLLADKDIKILLLPGENVPDGAGGITDIAFSKTKLMADYKGNEVLVGQITSPGISYSIVWKDDKIFEISAQNYERCVRCLGESFEDTAWRFADKIAERVIIPPSAEEKGADGKPGGA